MPPSLSWNIWSQDMVTVLRMTQIINMITSVSVWEEEEHQEGMKETLFSADHHHKSPEEVIQSRDRMSTESDFIKSYQASSIEKEEQHRIRLTQQQQWFSQRSITPSDTECWWKRKAGDMKVTNKQLYFDSAAWMKVDKKKTSCFRETSNCSCFLNQISFLGGKKGNVATLLAVDQKEKRLVL